jgi:hypothetical protein
VESARAKATSSIVPGQRESRGDGGQQRQSDQDAERGEEHRELLAGPFLARMGPARQSDDADDARDQGHQDQPETLLQDRRRRIEPADVEEKDIEQRVAVLRRGHVPEHREIPEKDLQQQRDVAQHLDVDGGQIGDQPVPRQPGNADDESDDRGEEDADDRDHDGVQQADQKGRAVTRLLAVFDQRLRDAEPGGGFQEPEARGDALPLQVGHRVTDQIHGQQHDTAEHERLEEEGAVARVVPHRRFSRRDGNFRLHGHVRLPNSINWGRGKNGVCPALGPDTP